jgi:hypothetical protein
MPSSPVTEALWVLGRRQEAAAEYGAVAQLRAATLGPDHPDTRQARAWEADARRELGET